MLPPPLPADIWWLVAEYIEPNPVEFANLATLSKLFHEIYTSDHVWRDLNVYGVESGIYRDFLSKSTPQDLKVMKGVWCYPLNRDVCTKYDVFSNFYLYLGYLVITPGGNVNDPETIDDKNLAMCALKLDEYCYFLDQFSPRLLRDRDLAMAAVLNRGCSLGDFIEFRNDRQVVLGAVKTGCPDEERPLEFASEELKDDTQLVLAAVRQNGYSLEHASDRLRRDRDIINQAIEQDAPAIEFAIEPDRDLILKAVAASPYTLQSLPQELRDDREIVVTALETAWESITEISPRFLKDPVIVKKIVIWYPEGIAKIYRHKAKVPAYQEIWNSILKIQAEA